MSTRIEGASGRHPGTAARNAIAYASGALVLAVVAALAIWALSGGGDEAPTVQSADAAPDFELEVFANENHTKGELVSLSSLEGAPVVINFWFPSCAPCRLEMPDLEQAFLDHKADGVRFLGVQLLGLDSVQDGQDFIDEFGITYAVGPDSGSIVLDYEVIAFPTTVFLNESHEIVRKWPGPLNGEKLEELIGELLQ